MKLSACNLNVAIDGHPVLHDIELEIPWGRKVGLLGPNGSGKSTLLRSLAGLKRESQGAVQINDRPLGQIPRATLATQLAFVAQHSPLEAEIRVEELVRLGRTPWRGLFSPWCVRDNTAVANALEQTRLSALRQHRVSQLSGGQQQRCHIARALAQQPDILLLDEPTNHLDIKYQLELMHLITSLPHTAVIALHDLNLAANYCDELIVLHNGTLAASGKPADVLTEALIYEVYGVHAAVRGNPRDGLVISFERERRACRDKNKRQHVALAG